MKKIKNFIKQYIDDIFYFSGWIGTATVGFSVDWRAGVILLSAGCFLTAFLLARGGRRE